MSDRILVIQGHPVPTSYCAALAAAYAAGARGAGAEVQSIAVHDLSFDPILHDAYNSIQALEPDLLSAQEAIRRARHVVFVFPIWWGVPPAQMKGFFDRAFHPSFAFKYEGTSVFQKKLLQGRSARVVMTMDSPPLYYRWVIGAPAVKMMKRSVLGFCGFRPVRCTFVGSVRFSTPERRQRWLRHLQGLGARCG